MYFNDNTLSSSLWEITKKKNGTHLMKKVMMESAEDRDIKARLRELYNARGAFCELLDL